MISKRFLAYLLLIPSAICLAFPIIWMFILSFRPEAVVLRGVESWFSLEFTFDNYIRLFKFWNIPQYLMNSIICSVIPTAICVIVGLLAGYALTRFVFPGRTIVYSMPLVTQLIPAVQFTIPLYILMNYFGLLDTYLAVIIAHTMLSLPFTIWMMASYLRNIPIELEESAMVDGCGRLEAVFRILIPVIAPGIIAITVVVFIATWGEFILGFTIISSEKNRLLSMAVYFLNPRGRTVPAAWGMFFALSSIYTVPVIIFFFTIQRFIIKGLTMGAVKQ